jgi:hypothetical protein
VAAFAPFAPWVLAIVAAATFARGVAFGFVFDDVGILCKSERIREVSSAYEVFVQPSQWIISDDANSHLITYRPLALGSMVLEFAASAGAPWIFHLTNVMLHVACVVLFWRLLRDTGANSATSFALALLFAVHPVGSEAITWINGRSEPICLLFGLIALSLCAREGPHTLRRSAALAAALCLSLLGKETGLAFLVLGCGFLARCADRHALARGTGAMVVGTAIYFGLRTHALSATHQQLSLSIATHRIRAAAIICSSQHNLTTSERTAATADVALRDRAAHSIDAAPAFAGRGRAAGGSERVAARGLTCST